MKIKPNYFSITSFLVMLYLAQAALAGTNTHHLDARQDSQHKRIERGITSGQITPLEAKNLKIQQDQIETAKNAAKADGMVTEEERVRLTRLQNQAKRTISRKKHNERKLDDVLDQLQFRR